MYFPVAGIEANPVYPVLFAFGISFFCSTTGISGAFLLLPYQFSILGYTSPGVSATNQIFNILACPAGAWRYAREGRLLFPLALFIISGTLPGVFLGAAARIHWFSNPGNFRIFAACVLLYLAWRMFAGGRGQGKKNSPSLQGNSMRCEVQWTSLKRFCFTFNDSAYTVSGPGLFCLSLVVGLVGGIYGVGGGAIMTPFLVSFFGLPVHAIAGASLFSTFVTSVGGVFFFSILAFMADLPQAAPDWKLGILLGIGGIFGMYCGAAIQKRIPARVLKIFLGLIILCTAMIYLAQSLLF